MDAFLAEIKNRNNKRRREINKEIRNEKTVMTLIAIMPNGKDPKFIRQTQEQKIVKEKEHFSSCLRRRLVYVSAECIFV